ncbi:MAG: hypothetical protein QX196_01085 [Methylococcaceae bacterium]
MYYHIFDSSQSSGLGCFPSWSLENSRTFEAAIIFTPRLQSGQGSVAVGKFMFSYSA